MIILNDEQAYSLTWFRQMIVDRNLGTAELSAKYCEELLEALKGGDGPPEYSIFYQEN